MIIAPINVIYVIKNSPSAEIQIEVGAQIEMRTEEGEVKMVLRVGDQDHLQQPEK